MRKVTQNAVNAFMSQGTMSESNTMVSTNIDETMMYLHGHHIARIDHESGVISINSCGWMTNTTKERLNGIPGVSIKQKDFLWYLNGKQWDGNPIEVTPELINS